jgi:AcrR family transcriptional regulator
MSRGERTRLDRDRVLDAAVALADEVGLEATSMRRLAETLGVTPMALYKHVADREELVDGMVDVVVAEIEKLLAADRRPRAAEWRSAVRRRILTARAVVLRHPWAQDAIVTRTRSSPVVLSYMDALIGALQAGGLPLALVHNAMHALSTRMWGFTRDVFPTPELPADPAARAAMLDEFARVYPHIVSMVGAVAADGGCRDDEEFAFALDLLLDGVESARLQMLGGGPAL